MARKSSEAQNTIAPAKDRRPRPPSDLNPSQAQVWINIVSNEPSDYFTTAATQSLLKEMVRHITSSHFLAQQIEAIEESGILNPDHFKDYQKLLSLRDKETRAIADKATKLRVTNQSRYTTKAAGTASRNTVKTSLWDFSG